MIINSFFLEAELHGSVGGGVWVRSQPSKKTQEDQEGIITILGNYIPLLIFALKSKKKNFNTL